MMQIDPGGVQAPLAPEDLPREQVWIEVRDRWTDDWQIDLTLTPVSAESVSGQLGAGQAVLRRVYGPAVKAFAQEGFAVRARARDLSESLVRLRMFVDEAPHTLWVGRVLGPQDEVGGDGARDADNQPQALGVEQWLCGGPRVELDRLRINSSHWDTDQDEATPLDTLPAFNLRGDNPALIGNRSAGMFGHGNFDLSFVFGAAAERWTAAQAADYLLQRYATRRDANGALLTPRWSVADQGLLDHHPRVRQDLDRNVGDLLRRLIPAERGLDYRLRYIEADEDAGVDEGFEIVPFGFSSEAIEFEGFEAPRNTAWWLYTVTARARDSVTLERSRNQAYSRIRLVGEPCVVAFSAKGAAAPGNDAGLDGVLENVTRGWADAEETAYRAGAGDPIDELRNDAARADPRFERVYSRYEIGTQFDFVLGYANPVFLPDGTWRAGSYEYQTLERSLLPLLPLEQGSDYTTDPPDGRGHAGEPQYLPLQAWIYVPALAPPRYVPLAQLPSLDPQYPGVEVRALEHSMGFALRATPRHLLARNHWQGATPSAYDPQADGLDWATLVVTAAIQTDHRPYVEAVLPPDDKADPGAVLEVPVNIAEFWLLARGTIVGFDLASGASLTAPDSAVHDGGIELRNDVPLLRELMPGAIARYQRERRRTTLRLGQRIEPLDDVLGQLLVLSDNVGTLQYDSACTAVRWDFEAPRGTVLRGGQATQ